MRIEPVLHARLEDEISPLEKMIMDLEPFKHQIKVGHLNTVSIPKHRDEIQWVVGRAGLDIFAASETNIKANTPAHRFNIPGYKLLRHDRIAPKGGVGIYFRDIFKPKRIDIRYAALQPEMIFAEVEINGNKIAIGVIYKPPSTSYNIYAEIQEVLAFITTKYTHVIIMGDFNIDLLKNDRPSEFFKNIVLQPFGLHEVIHQPTRITSNSATLIDNLLVTEQDCVKCSGVVDFPGISDHCMVYMAYNLKRPKFKPVTITRRDFRNFDKDNFRQDMELAPWGNVLTIDEDGSEISIDDKVTIVENIYKEFMDKHAPFKEAIIKRPVKSSWMTDDILEIMDTRDKYKNMFNRYKVDYFNDRYKELRNEVNHRIRRAKIKEFNETINDKIKDSKSFHNALKKHNVVSSKKATDINCPFPPDMMNDTFCESHNAEVDFEKITRTINRINCKQKKGGTFKLQQVTEDTVIKIAKSLKSNSTGVDEISAFFIKLSIDKSAAAITNIINASFRTGTFPDRWKKAIVIPIPKIDTPLSPTDFRPISLLSVLSKIIEKVVAQQIVSYLLQYELFDIHQSAYRINHGCSTALLTITDDFFTAMDKGDIIVLALLDYSKAFNCANHDITLAKLKSLGFDNTALRWINSYLSGRSQRVKTQNGFSKWKNLINGVPQGSILGPLLFTILLIDIKDSIKECNIHLYADDSQLYIMGSIQNIQIMMARLNEDLRRIHSFSDNNNLHLNIGKCKFIIIGSSQNLKTIDEINLPRIEISGIALKRKREVYDLGVLLDENLSWEKHCDKIIGKAYGKLREAYRAKNFLNRKSKIVIVESYVLSQFNYCDTVMQNLSQAVKDKIQKLQNACTRFIFGLRKYDHISQHFRELNSLNMNNRRILHSASQMHKITLGKAPTYLCRKIRYRNAFHLHNTRGNTMLHIPAYRNTYGRDRFFRKVAQSYNRFLGLQGFTRNMSISNFKKKLKDHLIENQ